jgi:hypothetical protein
VHHPNKFPPKDKVAVVAVDTGYPPQIACTPKLFAAKAPSPARNMTWLPWPSSMLRAQRNPNFPMNGLCRLACPDPLKGGGEAEGIGKAPPSASKGGGEARQEYMSCNRLCIIQYSVI